MRIELIRHGETALQADGRYQGSVDVPLSEKGKRKLVPAETMPDMLCVTLRIRTQQTAEILFPGLPQTVVPGLEEMDFGIFEGRNYREMEHDEQYRRWVDGMCEGRCPGGECREEFCSRVNKAFARLIRNAAESQIRTLAVVAHGGTIMAVLEAFCTEHRSYYDWHTASGKGFLLACDKPENGPTLRLLRMTDHIGR